MWLKVNKFIIYVKMILVYFRGHPVVGAFKRMVGTGFQWFMPEILAS
jgi:hypothetical protein